MKIERNTLTQLAKLTDKCNGRYCLGNVLIESTADQYGYVTTDCIVTDGAHLLRVKETTEEKKGPEDTTEPFMVDGDEVKKIIDKMPKPNRFQLYNKPSLRYIDIDNSNEVNEHRTVTQPANDIDPSYASKVAVDSCVNTGRFPRWEDVIPTKVTCDKSITITVDARRLSDLLIAMQSVISNNRKSERVTVDITIFGEDLPMLIESMSDNEAKEIQAVIMPVTKNS